MTDSQSLTPCYVAITMLDGTDKAVMSIIRRLAEHGYEAIIFQSGGRPAMEELAEADMLVGAIDFISCEPFSLEHREAFRIPQLVVPVCIGSCKNDLHGTEAAQDIARALNDARSQVVVMVPTKDLSISNADRAAFLHQLMKSLSAKVQLITIEADANSPRFANRVADEFLRMMAGMPSHLGGATPA